MNLTPQDPDSGSLGDTILGFFRRFREDPSPGLSQGAQIETPRAGIHAPGPKGYPILGSLLAMQREGQLGFNLKLWEDYGDIVQVKLGPANVFYLARPEHVKHIFLDHRERYCKGAGFAKVKLFLGEGLFASEGETWRRSRRTLQPLFTPKAIGKFGKDIIDATESLTQSWGSGSETINITQEMMTLAVSVISRTMFSKDLSDISPQVGQAVTYCLEFTSKKTLALMDLPMSIPTPSHRRFHEAVDLLDNVVLSLIQERREGLRTDDMLSRMLDARDEESGEGFSDKEIRDEIMTIFLAGHETTALSLTWALALLGKHPQWVSKIHQELQDVGGGEPIRGEDWSQLKVLQRVAMEVMRLYPPVWATPRDALVDDVIDGHLIPAGSMVILSQYNIHRHPEFWEDPSTFDPDRFLPEALRARDRYSYFPFGAGPRICLGNSFALMEIVLGLASILGRYDLKLEGEFPKEVAQGTLRPSEAVLARVSRRKST